MGPSWKRNSLIYIIILVVAVFLFYLVMPGTKKPQEVPLSEVIAMSQQKQIAKIYVDEDLLLVTTVDGKEIKTFKESYSTIYDIKGLDLDGIVVNIKGSSGIQWGSLMISILPFLLLAFLLFFMFRQARGVNSQAMSFGRSRAPPLPGQ